MRKLLDKLLVNHTSKDKVVLSAIITTDASYEATTKAKKRAFNIASRIYGLIIFLATIASLSMMLLTDQERNDKLALIVTLESFTLIVLLIDVALRWYTSEVRIKLGTLSYFLFPFTITGLMLIVSLLPSFAVINDLTGDNNRLLNTFHKLSILRIFRLLLLANAIPSFRIFKKVLTKEKSVLYGILSLVLVMIFAFALAIYSIEGAHSTEARGFALANYNELNHMNLTDANDPRVVSTIKVKDFLDAIYFSTVSLTTIGFGDITPITDAGKIIVVIMSILGIAVLATPTGVIAGGFISEFKRTKEEDPSKTRIIKFLKGKK